MPTKNIDMTVDEKILNKLDRLVKEGRYANRSKFIEEAIALRLQQLDAEFIGEQAKLLDDSNSENWFKGELELWQEKY